MGLMNRISTVIKQKVNTILDKHEDPREALEYSFVKQRELLNKLRRDMAEVITAKKRLEIQKAKLWDNIRTLDDQAARAVDQEKEDLAKLALQRKNANMMQLQELNKQITEMQLEQDKLEDTEKRLSTKVEEFRSKKEIIKAQYTAAEAQVRIKENVTGISEEMTDVGMALDKAEDKTEKMKAKSQALDDMIDSGSLTDYSTDKDDIEKELEESSIKDSVDQELAKLKAEKARKKKQTVEYEEQQAAQQ